MRRIALSIVLLLALLLVPAAAFAQDECTGTLDPESGILADSKEAMAALSSYATEATIEMNLENAPGLPSKLSSTLGIDGEFAIDPELTARFMEFHDMDPADVQANMEEMMGMIVELYQTIAFNLDLKLDLSKDLAKMLEASSGLPSFPDSVKLPTRMVDGFVYLNIDDVAKQFDAPDGVEGWLGIDYGTLMADSVDQMMAAMDDGDTASTAMTDSMASAGAMMALQQAAQQYVTHVAQGTERENGEEVCTVVATYDLAGFLSDPAFIQMLVEQMKAQMAMQAEMGTAEAMPMTEADIDMVAQMAPMLAPMLLSGLTLETTSKIGVEDSLVYSSESTLEWDMASLANMLGTMMAQSGQASPLDADNPPFFSLSSTMENSNFDEEFDVEVPDPVQIVPLENLQPAMD